MNRGEIWWVNMPAPSGRRPVVLASRQAAYSVRTTVTVVEITTTIRGIPSEVRLGKQDGLPRACVANTDSVVTIPKTWLDARVAPLRPAKLAELDHALRFSLGLA